MSYPDVLVSLPPAMAHFLNSDHPDARGPRGKWQADGAGEIFFGHDPEGARLGSGGGTVYLLWSAWQRATGGRIPFLQWLRRSPKVVVHAGGESRRLPAYASVGKCFCPLPELPKVGRDSSFRPLLRDQQVPFYLRAMEEAGPQARVLVTSGDVWLQASALQIPELTGDIAGVGMEVPAETAQYFGVYLVSKEAVGRKNQEVPVTAFWQKPSPERLEEASQDYDFYVDTGMWFLSEQAVLMLCKACGWQPQKECFATTSGQPRKLDLYGEIGESLGLKGKVAPRLQKAGLGKCAATVVLPRSAHFLHLGSSRQIFESLSFLQRNEFSLCSHYFLDTDPDLFPLREGAHTGPVWVEASTPPNPIKLGGWQLVTGLPEGVQLSEIPPEICLEVAPAGDDQYIFRPYHLDETYRGTISAGGTLLGIAARDWLRSHAAPELSAEEVFDWPVYPILSAAEIDDRLLQWMLTGGDGAVAEWFWSKPRISARQIASRVDLAGWFNQRERCFRHHLKKNLPKVLSRDNRLDYSALADWLGQKPNRTVWSGPNLAGQELGDPIARSRMAFLEGAVKKPAEGMKSREEGRRLLRKIILRQEVKHRSSPRPCLKDDQIVWARSPARLDLAGGWSDTPPSCLRHGGRVVNMAVVLNDQAPIQAFARLTPEKHLRIRSIDLGTSVVIRSYAELSRYTDPASGFSLPLAALALAGFHPDFVLGKTFPELDAQLEAFGAGVEITMLCAIPKGSGLGTSSILGATLLAALNRALGLGWDQLDLYHKVLAMEQLLTTGGGWQDQAGALFPGLKMIETEPGLSQKPLIRYLPERFFSPERANHSILLYYTGITRMAKGILGEIVNHMFLGEARTDRIVADLKDNASRLAEAIQVGTPADIHRCIRRSWRLNKQLDPGTTNPAIEGLLNSIEDDLAAAKLLGAGGGGYVLLFAHDAAAGLRIREKLDRNPPNERARFVDFHPSPRPLAVTVS